MALSPFYGWSEPDNSSLVKNGAADIRTLGDAIDTSVWNVGFGQAGKNKIINGDFNVNQRNFTTTTTSGIYLFDRFSSNNTGGTVTYTAQTFTLGTAPVAGYEGKNYLDIDSTGQSAAADIARVQQTIESVRTLANQAVTISFWAKAATGTPKVAVEIQQIFGSGGSPSSAVNTYFGQATLTTSWARYSLTAALPSISGKTLGTAGDDRLSVNFYTSAGSNFDARTGTLGIQAATISFWGIQVEYGSKATPFQTASGGSPQAELAMCQRYYQLIASGTSKILGVGYYVSATGIDGPIINLPVEMRTTPTISIVSGTNYFLSVSSGGGNDNLNSVTLAGESTNRTTFFYNNSEAAGTAGQGCRIQTNNAAAFLAVQAEL